MSIVASSLIAEVKVVGAALAKNELLAVGASVTIAAAALAIGLGVVAVKAAGDFQAGLTRLYTTAGESLGNLKMVGAGILGMSVDVGTGAQKLLQAMYWVESAGFHGAAGLSVLKIAAMGAKAENADLIPVAHALTGVLNTYASTGITAAQAMNVLIGSVGQGATTLQDFSGAISNVLPAGSKFHLQLIDLTTAIATMTNQNDNAASAATHLRQVILALESPAKAGAKALAEIGISSGTLHTAMSKSLPGAIQLIIDMLGKRFPEGSVEYNNALKAIAGGNKQLLGLLELSGTSLAKWKAAVKAVTSDVKLGGSSVMGWAEVQKNFNFKMDQAKAASEAFMIVLGTALLPTLGKLMGGISPIISGFVTWETKTHGIEAAIAAVSGAITNVVSVGASIINFFKNSQLACDILIGALAGLAAGLLAASAGAIIGFIATIPLIVGGFLAWAAAAGAAAIATLLAAAPFIAIGLVVAAVVVGIILAIQHWGAITAWLKGVWQAVVAWFGVALKNVETFFSHTWTQVKSVTSTVLGSLVGVIKTIGAGILSAFLSPITAVVSLFSWLYNHNYYFKALIDTIVNVVKGGLAWLQGAWTTAVNFVINVWNRLVVGAQIVWSFIATLIFGKATEAKGHVTSVFNSVLSFLTGIWNGIKTGVKIAWDFVVSIFQGIWGRVSGPVNTMKSNLVNWAAGLASSALQWGINLVQKFIDGLLSMLGQLLQAAANLAGAVAKALGFHSPTEYGPGRDADKWAPAFIDMYVGGLLAGIPRIREMAVRLASAMQSAMGSSSLALSIAGSYSGGVSGGSRGSGSPFLLSSGIAFTPQLHQPPVIVHVHTMPPVLSIDGRTFTDQVVGPHLPRLIRGQTGKHGPV